MTKGSPGKLILTFALPLMLGNMFQQAYTLVDTAVVGQVVGVNALAAVGSVDWFNWMSLGVCQGLTQGFSILLAQQFGARDEKGLQKTLGTSLVLSLLSALAVTILFLASTGSVLRLMGTREEILSDALLYIRIMFGGIIIVMTYNWLSAVLRAIGDSTTPLIAMGIASICNIVLDILFVALFHWGIAGAAAATLLAQVVSCIYCFQKIRKSSVLRIDRESLRVDMRLTRKLFSLGSPVALQNIIISIGGMILQSIVNSFGVVFVAGFTATNKLYGLLEIAAISFGYAVSTYAGQNLGAGEYERIRTGVKRGALMAIATSVLIAVLMLLFGEQLIGLFVEKGNPNALQVLDYGRHYLTVLSLFLPILYCLHIYRSALQGMGNTLIPMASGIAELCMRIGSAMILPGFWGEYGVYFAEVAAWTGAAVLLYVSYRRVLLTIVGKRSGKKIEGK